MLDLNRDTPFRPLALIADRSWREAPPPMEGDLTVAEAAALLGVTTRTVRRWCERIPGFGKQIPRVQGRWRVSLPVAAYVGAVLQAHGHIPIGALIKETERHTELMRGAIHHIRHPETVAKVKAFIKYRILTASARPARQSPQSPGDDVIPSLKQASRRKKRPPKEGASGQPSDGGHDETR